jgi:hypothetical protein
VIVGSGRTPGPGQVPWPGHPGSALGAVRQLTHPERRALTFKLGSARRRARHVARHPRSLHEADGHDKVRSLTAGGSDHRPGPALAKRRSRAGQRLERKFSAEPEITAPGQPGGTTIQPTGKPFDVLYSAPARRKDGKIVEECLVCDNGTSLTQIGLAYR